MIGACDGVTDQTIMNFYMNNNNSHFRGIFIEPIQLNYNELLNFTKNNHKISNRTFLLSGAVNETCENSTIIMYRPIFEETHPNAPHWIRRQIGSLKPKRNDLNWFANKLHLYNNNNQSISIDKILVQEITPCIASKDLIINWLNLFYYYEKLSQNIPNYKYYDNNGRSHYLQSRKQANLIRYVHILKIDTEGNDYSILKGMFMKYEVRKSFPFLILFEHKMLKEHEISHLRSILIKRGYLVSNFSADSENGFALLQTIQTDDLISFELV
eukprot:gene10016-13472_t